MNVSSSYGLSALEYFAIILSSSFQATKTTLGFALVQGVQASLETQFTIIFQLILEFLRQKSTEHLRKL